MRKLSALLVLLWLPFTPLRAEPAQTDSAALRDLIEQGVAVIDVRTAQEWQATGVIKGSHLITFFDQEGNYDAAAWVEKLAAIAPPDQPVALICAAGNRSQLIAQFLEQQVGYTQVHNVSAGIQAWIAEGNAVVPAAAE